MFTRIFVCFSKILAGFENLGYSGKYPKKYVCRFFFQETNFISYWMKFVAHPNRKYFLWNGRSHTSVKFAVFFNVNFDHQAILLPHLNNRENLKFQQLWRNKLHFHIIKKGLLLCYNYIYTYTHRYLLIFSLFAKMLLSFHYFPKSP